MGNRVAVALSGGLDSSVAAALLKDDYDIFGVTMRLSGNESVNDACRVCRQLDIPCNVFNFESRFETEVIDYFIDEYSRGQTPNPCVVCNQKMKFGLLLDEAEKLGAEYLATGHYARIEKKGASYRLLKSVDRRKDQSYFLYRLGQEELKHIMFPLGTYRKDEVRRIATELGLPSASQRESQEVCFIPGDDYRSFLKQYIPDIPGDIVDTNGIVIGKHRGISRYTIGQRQGLGVASGERLFVIKIDAEANTVIVGPEETLYSHDLLASEVSFVSGKPPHGKIEVSARIRSRSPEVAGTLEQQGNLWSLKFNQPQRAVAPGQSVVFYRGDEVLGGGIIDSGS